MQIFITDIDGYQHVHYLFSWTLRHALLVLIFLTGTWGCPTGTSNIIYRVSLHHYSSLQFIRRKAIGTHAQGQTIVSSYSGCLQDFQRRKVLAIKVTMEGQVIRGTDRTRSFSCIQIYDLRSNTKILP